MNKTHISCRLKAKRGVFMGIFNSVCVCGPIPAVKGHGNSCGTLMLLLQEKECFWQDWCNASWRMNGQGSNHSADFSFIYSKHTRTHSLCTTTNLSGIFRQQDVHGCVLPQHSIALQSITTVKKFHIMKLWMVGVSWWLWATRRSMRGSSAWI